MLSEARLAAIQNLVETEEWEALATLLRKLQSVEIAEILQSLQPEHRLQVFGELDVKTQGAVAEHFSTEMLYEIYQAMDKKRFAQILSHASSDVRADFYRSLSREEQLELLPFFSRKIRDDIVHLSTYEPESAGGIMITDFATIEEDMRVSDALKKIKEDNPSNKMIYYVYVVDEDMKMIGFVTIKDLILADPKDKIADLVKREFVYANVDEDRESVARKIEKYNLLAIPVLNHRGQIAGIITHDDAMDVIRAEHTEDLEKFMGIVPADKEFDYLNTPSWRHFLKRVVWVTSLAAIGIISGLIIHRFERALEKLIILAIYMPMVADTGGNTGSQAATVVVRALALGQISVKQWMKVIYKEAKIAFLLALVLGVLSFAKVVFLSWEAEVPQEYSLYNIATAIALALSLQVISATIIGASLPLIVKKLGGDPAVAASPAITTIVDITGMLIYFGTAVLLLRL
ncbi:MAG: magnesium transporter [Leptospiraceae bacterium]|nr:magnesium transporter [Leptospiraceae bacterium]MDW8307185.1 magnesium transporter [Leptospiraceae bacterium]